VASASPDDATGSGVVNVLWVTPYAPDKRGGAGVSSEFELLRMAARRHDIEVVAGDVGPDTTRLDLGDGEVPMAGVVWRSQGAAHNKLTFASQFVRAWPSHEQWLLHDRLRALREEIRRRRSRRAYDLVHFTSAELASLVGTVDAPTVLLAFDVFSRQCAREREIAQSRAASVRWSVEERRVTRWERKWLPRFDGIATVTDVDADAIRVLTGLTATVLPTPVPDPYFATPDVSRDPRTVTFVANLDYRPNIDAIEWLVSEIWPAVVASVPDAELVVVGANPAPSVLAAVERSGGALHPNVPDVRPYYWRSAVAVAPIRSGSGLRNKVLHAMACGAPVVATSTAIEGIRARAGRDLFVADDPTSFATAVIQTLQDRGAAAQRANAAVALLEPYRSDAIGERFDTWWSRAVETAT